MEIAVRARRGHLDAQTKQRVEDRFAKLSRYDGRIDRVEVEVTFETRGRIGGGHRVDASCQSGRRTYRAHAEGDDVLMALDRLIQRLERQISDAHGKKRNRVHRLWRRLRKVQSARMGSNEGEPPALT
ncbi:MAG: ribosome hibernation-promoting factor, HPF/YfiA family [Actinomycetota bacterium]